jgi:hypothetical protein
VRHYDFCQEYLHDNLINNVIYYFIHLNDSTLFTICYAARNRTGSFPRLMLLRYNKQFPNSGSWLKMDYNQLPYPLHEQICRGLVFSEWVGLIN